MSLALVRPIALLVLLAPGDARPGVEFTEDSLEVVLKNVAAERAVLVDVRSQEEWDRGHVAGAVFLPVTSLRKHSLDVKKLAKTLPKKKVLYTYCAVGMRAKAAAAILQAHGYSVRPLKPGYEALLAAGFRKDERKPAQPPTPPTDRDNSR